MNSNSQYGYVAPRAEGVVDLTKSGFVEPLAGGPVHDHNRPKITNEDLADMLHKVMDFKKSDSGLLVPKVEAGDTVIVDRANSAEFKVLDATDGTFEKIPKRAVKVESEKKCVCALRDILMGGCRCGGV